MNMSQVDKSDYRRHLLAGWRLAYSPAGQTRSSSGRQTFKNFLYTEANVDRRDREGKGGYRDGLKRCILGDRDIRNEARETKK